MSEEIRVRSERWLDLPPPSERLPPQIEPLAFGTDAVLLKEALATAAQRADEQAALYQFTDKLYRSTSLDDIYGAAFDAIGSALRCYRASILLFDEAGVMRFVAWRGLSADYRRAVDGHTPWKPGETDPEPVCIEDIDAADLPQPLKDVVKSEGIGALAFIPLVARLGVIGKFMIYYEARHPFQKDELSLAIAIARQLGFGIERARADQSRDATEAALRASEALLAQELEDTRLLQSISAKMIEQDNAEDVYQEVLVAAVRIMRSDKASMQVLDDRENALRLLAFRGFDPEFGKVFELCRPDSGTSCNVARQLGRRVIVPDVETCDFIVGTTASHDLRKSGIRAVQSTPLISRSGKLLGMISTHWRHPHQPGERNLRMLDLLARQAADLIESKQAQAAVQQLAAIVESSADAIVTKDLNAVITSWNQGAERLFGYTAAEAIGQHITILIPPDRRSEEDGFIERIRRGQRVEHFETVRRHKNGSLIDISLMISPLKNAKGKIVGASKIARNISERKRSEAQIVTLAREAEHRAKNILANVQATVRLSQADTPEGLKRSIEGRIQALANVHRLFVQSQWGAVDLHTLVKEELSPYCQEDDERASISGPVLLLETDMAQSIAVTLHELTTNAAKYGALSVPEGRVQIEWSPAADGRVVLRWSETGGPPVKPPTRHGFGMRVVDSMICKHLKGEINVDWRAGGLMCEMTLVVAQAAQ
jgi:PAS domain S-box-containing protein